jgi:hypothetical protein
MRWFPAVIVALVMMLTGPLARSQPVDPPLDLPDSPTPSLAQTSTPAAAGQSDSHPSPPAAPAPQLSPEEQRKKAQEQLEQQEHQRVMRVMATFNTTGNKDAVPLTAGQKYQLFFKSATDPWPFLLAAFLAGIDQADNSFPQYGQGLQGYGKRFGASYTDYFVGNFFGNAVLSSALHEDPRYYQKGTGSYLGRALWAASGTVWCKRDSGSWGPNYANVMGNMIGAAISNVYYPAPNRTVGGTLERGVSVTAQAIIGSEVIEFWPDMVRHHNRKQAEKLARQQGANTTAQPAPQPAAPPPPAPQP